MAAQHNPARCPKCNRIGSSDPSIKHLCKGCLAKEVCTQCGKPAFKYIDRSPLHSWYCEYHYDRQMQSFIEEPQYIARDEFISDNVFTTDKEFVSDKDAIDLIKDKFGYEER